MSGSNETQTIRVAQYYMAIHYGICHGPANIWGFDANDKNAWRDWIPLQVNRYLNLRHDYLFEGIKKQGGLAGNIWFQPGQFHQTLPADLYGSRGVYPKFPGNCRGLATVCFDGAEQEQGRGFYWAANVPNVPKLKFHVTRIFSDWFGRVATIGELSRAYNDKTKTYNDLLKKYLIIVDRRETLKHADNSEAMPTVKQSLLELKRFMEEVYWWPKDTYTNLEILVWGNNSFDTFDEWFSGGGGDPHNQIRNRANNANLNRLERFINELPDDAPAIRQR